MPGIKHVKLSKFSFFNNMVEFCDGLPFFALSFNPHTFIHMNILLRYHGIYVHACNKFAKPSSIYLANGLELIAKTIYLMLVSSIWRLYTLNILSKLVVHRPHH